MYSTWYIGYNGCTVAGTQAMTQYHAWYIGYDGGLLWYCSHEWNTLLVQNAMEGYKAGTHSTVSINLNEGLQLVAKWSGRPRMG